MNFKTEISLLSTDFMKLEIYNYLLDMTPRAKFQGATSTWVVWSNSQFDAWKFLFFVCFFTGAKGRISGHTPTRNTSWYVVLAKVVLFGVKKDEIWNLTPFAPENVKIGTLGWRSMENCSRPNSGTVSRIQFKLGTEIDHPSGIRYHDSKVKRSKI